MSKIKNAIFIILLCGVIVFFAYKSTLVSEENKNKEIKISVKRATDTYPVKKVTTTTPENSFYPPTQPSKTVPTTVPQAPISKPRPQAPSVYSYATSISYNVPNGGQTMDVNISLQNKVVVSVSISQSKRGGTSAEYQQNFQNSYKSYVVGKNINDISLSRVGGASLTTNAFNKAINSIKSNL